LALQKLALGAESLMRFVKQELPVVPTRVLELNVKTPHHCVVFGLANASVSEYFIRVDYLVLDFNRDHSGMFGS